MISKFERFKFESELHWIDASKVKSLPIAAKDLEPQENEDSDMEDEHQNNNNKLSSAQNEKNSRKEEVMSLEDEAIMKKYGLDTYDQEDSILPQLMTADKLMNRLKLGSEDIVEEIDDEEGRLEDLEDFLIRKDDGIILATRTDDELSHLDVFIYSEENLYLHHDILLDSYPLCFSWVGVDPNQQKAANFVAVGLWDPHITIWNLDIIDQLDPSAILGGKADNVYAAPPVEAKGKKKKKKAANTSEEFIEGSHTDSVLSLCWNTKTEHLLASASADHTVKVWDLYTTKCATTIKVHSDKVQTIEWHLQDPSILLSGGFDQTVYLLDVRYPDKAASFKHSSQIEKVKFNTHQPNGFYVSREDGFLFYHDIRNMSAPVWTLKAHDDSCVAFDIHPLAGNLLVSGSPDKSIKLWLTDNNQPSNIHTINCPIPVYSLEFSAKYPQLLAAGGQGPSMLSTASPEDSLEIYDMMDIPALQTLYQKQTQK